LDNRLTWETHIQYLCKRLSRVLFLLRKLKTCVTQPVILSSYYAFFHSLLSYGIRLWGGASSSSSAFIWQKKAIRIINNLNHLQSCRESFSQLKIMTLPSMYIYTNLLHVKEYEHLYSDRAAVHNHNTRNKYCLNLPQFRLSKSIHSHYYQQIQFFNKLPDSVRALNLSNFKGFLKELFQNNVFYSINE